MRKSKFIILSLLFITIFSIPVFAKDKAENRKFSPKIIFMGN